MNATFWTSYESPLGPLTLAGDARGLGSLSFPGRGQAREETRRDDGALADTVQQLDAYFAGTRRGFTLRLALDGTPFQRRVWAQLAMIGFGETTTYGAIARAIGRSDRIRAVAAAIGRTPVPIIVPCHRVIGADGSLTGYGGGLHRKLALLEHEAAVTGGAPVPDAWRARQLALV